MTVTGDDDFRGYVAARWPLLVRTAVLVGCPVEHAPDVVTTALARCRRGWREAAQHDDLDVVVHTAVLDAWVERLRGPWWADLRPVPEGEWPPPDLSELDRLTPGVRAGVVLRRLAGLDAGQAAAVAGQDAGGPLPSVPDAVQVRAAAEQVVVLAPPDDEALSRAEAPARRSRLVGAVAAVVVLAGLGAWTVVAATGDADDAEPGGSAAVLPAVEPDRRPNAAEVAYWSDGVLQLANATYAVPDVEQLATLGAGAVYGDADGDVVHLADDGTRERLGRKDPSVPMVVSDEQGWVAWVDPGQGGERPRLVVHDLAQGEVIGERDLPPSRTTAADVPDTRPVAIDGDLVYVQTSDGWGAWRPGEADYEDSGSRRLYDVASRNRVVQLDRDRVVLEQSFFNEPRVVPGRGGELAPDGNYAVTRSPADGSVLVYDTRSGERVDLPQPPPVTVVDAVLSPELSITYLAVDPGAFSQPSGSDSTPSAGALVTCSLLELTCGEPVGLVISSEAPVLAR